MASDRKLLSVYIKIAHPSNIHPCSVLLWSQLTVAAAPTDVATPLWHCSRLEKQKAWAVMCTRATPPSPQHAQHTTQWHHFHFNSSLPPSFFLCSSLSLSSCLIKCWQLFSLRQLKKKITLSNMCETRRFKKRRLAHRAAQVCVLRVLWVCLGSSFIQYTFRTI